MLFLLLALVFSAVLALVLKYLNTGSPYGVYLVNYITCAVLAFATLQPRTLYNGDATPAGWGLSPALSIWRLLRPTATASTKTGRFSPRCSPGWGCWCRFFCP